MVFGEKILEYKDDILNTLAQLIAIESVSAYGSEKPQQALEYMLDKASQLGLATENVDNVAGHIQYGNGEKLCGVLTHLDVVPAGNGWSTEPFALTRKNGRLYGRGIADDKGSAVIAMYCLKALKDNNITANSRLRLILGTNEETGMTDVQHYFSKMPLPDISFTPDSDYGICNCEKGILQFALTGKNNSKIISSAKAGCAVNAVPDKAELVLSQPIGCTPDEDYLSVDGNKLVAKGIASHAMEPHKGFNSISHAVKKLKAVFKNENLGDLAEFICRYIGTETNGKSMGIACSDEASGELTLNLGVLEIDSNTATARIDIRYPVTASYEEITDKIKSLAEEYNLEYKDESHLKPLNVAPDSDIIKLLSSAYNDITGQLPELYSTGGGTYARALGNRGVAFGPVFPDDYSNMHKPDESLDEEKFFLHAQICLQAMYKMFTGE